jgi:hypothetical protein
MRTAIYVYADHVDFVLRSDISELHQFNGGAATTPVTTSNGTVTLPRGIYKLVTAKPTEIRMTDGVIGDSEIVVVVNDKDPWPDPPERLTKGFPAATTAALRGFLPQSLGAFDMPQRKSS